MDEPIVKTGAEAAKHEYGAALVLDPLREFLDGEGIGSGELRATELGDGHSNLTFLLHRGEEAFVVRRPPRGDLAGSANDVLRESRILAALGDTAVPVPSVLARCEDPAVIGSPFFVMSYVPGEVISDSLPPALDVPAAPVRIGEETVNALDAVHRVDLETTGLTEIGRASGYLERQLRRFGSLLDVNATRPLPELETVGEWLAANLPASRRSTLVHGDFRLGNLLFGGSLGVAAVLDWEMATLGDPLADLGYLTAMWTAPGDGENPMFALSRTTRGHGFAGREELAEAYASRSGEPIDDLRWYQVLALWKSAIFLEGSYRRFSSGASADPYFASLGEGVPLLARAALAWSGQA